MGRYFNRGGFCFAFKPVAVDGVFYLLAYFQNQAERPCRGRIALRPARQFLMNRRPIETIHLEIDCEPAAFGIAKVAVPLPLVVQGKDQAFEVGASVEYPQGKGRRLRFYAGQAWNPTPSLWTMLRAMLALAGLLIGRVGLAGHMFVSRHATVKIQLPGALSPSCPTGSSRRW